MTPVSAIQGLATTPASIGVAFLGVGRMGQTHIQTLAGIAQRPGPVVVADEDPGAAERGRGDRPGRPGHDGPARGDHRSAVEAVVISTPTSTHAGLIEAALRAGKAVWSEKPIALDLVETNRLVELWRETGLPVQLGFMRRFDPGYVRARELIVAGELGRIEQFRAYSRDTYPPSADFIKDSGGSFLDMSVHDFDLARFLVGEVEEVSAWGNVLIDQRFGEGDDIDTSVTMLRFRNGALGVVEMSRRLRLGLRHPDRGCRGDRQGRRRGAPQDGPHLQRGGSASRAIISRASRTASKPAIGSSSRRSSGPLPGAGRPTPGPDEALETLRLAIAARRSWREGRPVRVDDVTPENPA